MARLRRIAEALRIERFDPRSCSLFEFRPVGIVPVWLQASLIVGLFVATVLCTYAEYRESGTVFGFAGPAFNVLFNPIYEELIFRGWLLGMLARYYSSVTAIILSSLLFGLVHLRNIYWLETGDLIRMMVFTGLILAPVLGYVTMRFRTVWPAVILHYLNNLAYYL